MDGRLVLATVVVVFGLYVPCPMASTTSTLNGYLNEASVKHIIDNLMVNTAKNLNDDPNIALDVFIKNFTDFVFNNFSGIIIDNSTKFNFDKSTKFTFHNSTDMHLLAGLNVCTRIKNYKTKNVITQYEIRLLKVPYLCFKNWRFKCYYINETTVPVQTEILENNFEILSECCNGYEKTPNRSQCHPVCENPCIWGICISPNVCRCEKYFEDPTCSLRIGCPPGTFGLDCTQTCQCQNNGYCNYLNGSCTCQPGYRGKYCEEPCPSGYFGHECKNLCKCQVDAICDQANGACYCLPGYAGINCESKCPPGFYGDKCKNECKYQNGTQCDVINGNCSCPSKNEEQNAEVNECDCQNGTLCSTLNETCSCQPGHEGNNCKFTCPLGYYGKTCQNLCKCKNDEKCDPVNGDCYCSPGYTGENCSSICPSGFYGHQCQHQCKCQNSGLCDPVNGACICKDGWTGNECDTLCPPGTYGVNCESNCTHCQNGAECRVTDGNCVCETGFVGPTCSEESGKNFSTLQSERSNNEVWMFDIMVILSFLIISTICVAVMMCYLYYCHRCDLGHVNHLEHRKSTNIEPNPNIQVICTSLNCGTNKKNVMLDLRKPMTSYTNQFFYENYARDRCYDDETGENLYLEIDESTFERAEDLYDHLDFLRPTASWKPHYQSAIVLQEQGSNSLKKEEA